MNNGFGTSVLFACKATLSGLTGSIVECNEKHSATKKAITDGADAFVYIGITQRFKTFAIKALFEGSASLGSGVAVPEIGDLATFASPMTAGGTGTWGVTESSLDMKADDAVYQNIEVTQWYKADGTTLP